MMYRWATEADAPAMAALFAANHREALTERQRDEQGFVQGGFDAATLRSMAAAGTLLVADDDGQVAGLLALAGPDELPAPPPVVGLLAVQDTLRWEGRPLSEVRWLLYGPVVVDAAYRGRGVARGLFTVEAAAARADAVVAFIESTNRPSWRVHVDGFGMRLLGEYVVDGRTYSAVAAAVRAPGGA
ncbi:GNAT family N-acetyltransferase [Streptomyces sp. NBC_00120]|uniref:GNAT family N-acetyltransferase n=1 Tax=Streptomyces sp. NBC_00120 TaxID=2975660 RepID=UPI0022528D5D|nr:GNAT family N-acetyltransferase [Streptomyces sp. NBC_00120]MCX5320360.1 GNAT family N-acetyltransferase [Streptomyces sp. NBC_00120]